MIDLSVDAIKDYQTCALLYDFRHLQNRYEPIARGDELSVRFENTMRSIVSFFFYKKQAGIVPSVSAIINRWEKNWFPKDMTPYDLAVEQHDILNGNLASFSSEGIRSLLRFYDDFAEDIENDPLLINEDFIIPLNGEIKLTGTFDLVLRNKRNVYTVIKWSTSTKKVPASSMNMEFAALKMAFKYRNDNRPMNVRYGYYDLVSAGKFGFHEVEVPDADLNSLTYWAEDAVSNQIFAPRRGLTSYCRGCPFDTPCRDFEVTEQMLEIKRSL